MGRSELIAEVERLRAEQAATSRVARAELLTHHDHMAIAGCAEAAEAGENIDPTETRELLAIIAKLTRHRDLPEPSP